MDDIPGKFLRVVRRENTFLIANDGAPPGGRRGDARQTHGERLEQFVLHAARHSQRRDEDLGSIEIGACVRNPARTRYPPTYAQTHTAHATPPPPTLHTHPHD